MKAPHLEHGKTTIANGVLEALKQARLGPVARAIVDHVIEGTWGLAAPQKTSVFRVRDIAKEIGGSAKVVGERLRFLVDANVLVEFASRVCGERVLGFQKYKARWRIAEAAQDRRQKRPKQLTLFRQSTNDPVPPSLRFSVLQRDAFTCRYCGASAPTVTLVVDHVVPRSAGGLTDASNLVTACETCNAGKGHAPLLGTSPQDIHTTIPHGEDGRRDGGHPELVGQHPALVGCPPKPAPVAPRAERTGACYARSHRFGSSSASIKKPMTEDDAARPDRYFADLAETPTNDAEWSAKLRERLAENFGGHEQVVADAAMANARVNGPKVGVTPQAYLIGILRGKYLLALAGKVVEKAKCSRARARAPTATGPPRKTAAGYALDPETAAPMSELFATALPRRTP